MKKKVFNPYVLPTSDTPQNPLLTSDIPDFNHRAQIDSWNKKTARDPAVRGYLNILRSCDTYWLYVASNLERYRSTYLRPTSDTIQDPLLATDLPDFNHRAQNDNWNKKIARDPAARARLNILI